MLTNTKSLVVSIALAEITVDGLKLNMMYSNMNLPTEEDAWLFRDAKQSKETSQLNMQKAYLKTETPLDFVDPKKFLTRTIVGGPKAAVLGEGASALFKWADTVDLRGNEEKEEEDASSQKEETLLQKFSKKTGADPDKVYNTSMKMVRKEAEQLWNRPEVQNTYKNLLPGYKGQKMSPQPAPSPVPLPSLDTAPKASRFGLEGVKALSKEIAIDRLHAGVTKPFFDGLEDKWAHEKEYAEHLQTCRNKILTDGNRYENQEQFRDLLECNENFNKKPPSFFDKFKLENFWK